MSEAENAPAPMLEFLTRRQAGARLGLSISAIRKLEKQGKLHGVRRRMLNMPGYRYVFREEEVDRIAASRKFVGEPVASIRDARVFKAFRAGKSVADVVIDLELPADVVERLWGYYVRGRDAREGAPPPAPPAPTTNELEELEAKAQREHEQRLREGLDLLSSNLKERRRARARRRVTP